MHRTIAVFALLAAATAALAAQQTSPQDPQQTTYQGVSHPPADDAIVTTSDQTPKPPAGHPIAAPAPAQAAPVNESPADAAPASAQDQPRSNSGDPAARFTAADGTDGGMVSVAPSGAASPSLNARSWAGDPDGDIVHPHPLRAGELEQGTTIRVHLLDRLSTVETEKGEPFRTQVASDVLQGGQVVIPAGAEIDGRVVEVSRGHAGGHGSMRLQPESVILPNGARYRLRAEVTGAPGSRTHVAGEGTIAPNSRLKRDGIEYGGAVGAGVVTGAIVAGPAGAFTGGLIGAGAVTVHLLVSHPQATLESGTTLLFQLTDRLYLAPEAGSGS
ncbi:MAG: hypothetical protein P4L26_09785 [Terracidiphilus sp.]|nr:hypothetical protein [Terracidiphilus sp.]